MFVCRKFISNLSLRKAVSDMRIRATVKMSGREVYILQFVADYGKFYAVTVNEYGNIHWYNITDLTITDSSYLR